MTLIKDLQRELDAKRKEIETVDAAARKAKNKLKDVEEVEIFFCIFYVFCILALRKGFFHKKNMSKYGTKMILQQGFSNMINDIETHGK